MNLETTITPEMRFELLQALRWYRAQRPEIKRPSFESEIKYEREIAEDALGGILRILSRGIAPALDLEVIDAMAQLKDKARPTLRGPLFIETEIIR